MNYTAVLRPSAQKELNAVPDQEYKLISKIISDLEQNPRSIQSKKLAGGGLWRIRVKRYRVIYKIDDTDRLIIIVRVARRREDTYKKLK